VRLLIVGYGIVGKALHRTFPDADIYDLAVAQYSKKAKGGYDIAFICVPTDMRGDGSADTRIVDEVIEEHVQNADVVVIKSTVPPRTTGAYEQRGYPIVMSPEFDGATQHSRAIDEDFVILGGAEPYRSKVAEAYKAVKPADFRILKTDSLTAELVKYGENAYLYNRVVFFNEWYRICRTFGADYDEWRELLRQDPRISPAHSFVYRDHPYVSSHCLDKDIPAIIQASLHAGYEPRYLAAMDAINEGWKKEYHG